MFKMKKILIVDDSKSYIHIFKSFLNLYFNDNISIYVAYNGTEAIHQFKENNPDLVLMDYHMPSMNGLEALKKIIEIKCDSMVIILSSDDSIRNKALKHGAIAFVPKRKRFSMIMDLINDCFNKNLEEIIIK